MIYWTYEELNEKFHLPGPFESMGEWMKKIGDSVTTQCFNDYRRRCGGRQSMER